MGYRLRCRFVYIATMLIAVALAGTGCPGRFKKEVRVPAPGHTDPPQWYTWKPATPMPAPTYESAVADVDGKMFVFGGFGAGLKVGRAAYVYDPIRDRWARLPDAPYAVTHLNAVVDGRRIWFAGGFEGDNPGRAVAYVWTYDIDSHAYAESVPLPEPRAGGAAALVGRQLHYIGGLKADRDTDAADHWALDVDTGGDWAPLAPLPRPRCHIGAAVVGQKIYCIGGQQGHDSLGQGPFTDVTYVDIYDTATDTWIEGAPIPKPLSHFEPGTFVLNDWIIAAGGRSVMDDVAEVWAFDVHGERWIALPYLPAALKAPGVRVLGNKVVCAGGRFRREQARRDVWVGELTQQWAQIIMQRQDYDVARDRAGKGPSGS